MAFLSPLLLAGVALVAIPIVLHLRRRQDPVRVEFPALRLLKRNQQRNQTRLRVRRWLLLSLRCLLLVALAAALARPLLRPGGGADADATGPAGEAPAMAIVLDTGPNANYQARNRSRLEAAQAEAGWLLGQLPADTPTVLADRSPSGVATVLDAASAAARIERLRVSPAARRLATVVADAVDRLAETPASRRLAYVFTDLSEGAWDPTAQAELSQTLQRRPGVELRLVDVGAREPRNVAVTGLRVADASLSIGEPLRLTATVEATGGEPEDVTAELWLDDGPADPIKRDQRLVKLTPGEPAELSLTLAGLEEGFHTGVVRLLAGDGAPLDDTRHFAVEVRRPRSVLLVESNPGGARFVQAAIDPPAAERGAARPIETEVLSEAAWPRQRLAGYDAVLLLDPSPAIGAGRGWRRLYDFAASGGGVGLVLGPNATLDAFNTPEAQAITPGKLAWRSREATHLGLFDRDHPAVRALAPYAADAPWPLYPVRQRWELNEVAEAAATPVRYADGAAAVVERAVGRGRVVLLTTSLAESRNDREAWNELLTGDEPWPGLLLVDSLARYLADGVDAPLSYLSGQTVRAPLPRGVDTPAVVLRTPAGEVTRQPTPPGRSDLSIPGAIDPGAYRLEAGGDRSLVDRRFVVNLNPRDTRLARVPFESIRDTLGPTRVRLLSDRDELAASLDLGSTGIELTAWVLALAAIALAGEQALARGYQE